MGVFKNNLQVSPPSWHISTHCASVTAPMDYFRIASKFLALKEIRLREGFHVSATSTGAVNLQCNDRDRLTKLQVNLDMQNQMLGRCVDAGLTKVRKLR
jgi:hypothetical protein